MKQENFSRNPNLPPEKSKLEKWVGFRGPYNAGADEENTVEMKKGNDGVYKVDKIGKRTAEEIQELIKKYKRVANGDEPAQNTFEIKV